MSWKRTQKYFWPGSSPNRSVWNYRGTRSKFWSWKTEDLLVFSLSVFNTNTRMNTSHRPCGFHVLRCCLSAHLLGMGPTDERRSLINYEPTNKNTISANNFLRRRVLQSPCQKHLNPLARDFFCVAVMFALLKCGFNDDRGCFHRQWYHLYIISI